ncbi:hypothetical protein DFJ74DRAFT_457522 [Hyaloraphidium curvatum]|nr:hypothetical protein DFJ74DRAFT_457522 [Hyaloraphidium curvatum]
MSPSGGGPGGARAGDGRGTPPHCRFPGTPRRGLHRGSRPAISLQRTLLISLIALLAAAAVAAVPSPSTAPPSTSPRCATDAQCPAGQVCHPFLDDVMQVELYAQRCVDAEPWRKAWLHCLSARTSPACPCSPQLTPPLPYYRFRFLRCRSDFSRRNGCLAIRRLQSASIRALRTARRGPLPRRLTPGSAQRRANLQGSVAIASSDGATASAPRNLPPDDNPLSHTGVICCTISRPMGQRAATCTYTGFAAGNRLFADWTIGWNFVGRCNRWAGRTRRLLLCRSDSPMSSSDAIRLLPRTQIDSVSCARGLEIGCLRVGPALARAIGPARLAAGTCPPLPHPSSPDSSSPSPA